MGTRVLSLWLPYAATDRHRYESMPSAPGQSSRPRATCLEDEPNQPLDAVCPRAEQAGLLPGMGREEAVRRVPGLLVHPSDPERDDLFLKTCLSWCEGHTPFVAIDRSASAWKGISLWLDIGSSAHLAGGEASLLAGLLARFRKAGVTTRAAIADHPGSAWAACRFGHDEQRILPPNGARVALAAWPPQALRLEQADCERLERAGLDRIEHLYALPRRSLSARFGDHVATRLDQAMGLIDEPISADIPRPAQQAQMMFAEPITCPKALPALIERLVRQLCIGLEAAGLGARRLTLALYRVDNSTVTCSVGSDRPSRDVSRLSALVGDRFDKIDLGFGIERAILDAVEIEPVLSETIRWRGLGTAGDEPLRDLACQPRQTAHGARPWARSLRPSRPPAAPFLRDGPARMPSPPVTGGQLATAFVLAPDDIRQPALQEAPPPPLRLLRRPEPIEAIVSLPDEPPVLFRWRQHLHKIVSARGPETVAPDWWRLPEADLPQPRPGGKQHAGDPAVRDYFAVEDSEGARFWLFREGRYDSPSETLPRWFLHGIFG